MTDVPWRSTRNGKPPMEILEARSTLVLASWSRIKLYYKPHNQAIYFVFNLTFTFFKIVQDIIPYNNIIQTNKQQII